MCSIAKNIICVYLPAAETTTSMMLQGCSLYMEVQGCSTVMDGKLLAD
jgi:hypothetical protein